MVRPRGRANPFAFEGGNKIADQYKPILGFVQFDVNERDAGSQKVRDFVIQPGGSGDVPALRVTLWPEYGHVDVEKGDLVVVEGQVKTNVSNGKTYFNLSPTKLKVFKSETKLTDGVENAVEEEDDAEFDPGF